jgi:hypothetical protein
VARHEGLAGVSVLLVLLLLWVGVSPPPWFVGVVFGVVLWLLLGFGVFLSVLLSVFWCCMGTVQLLFCLRGSWWWFPGVFRVPFVVGRVFLARMLDPLSSLWVRGVFLGGFGVGLEGLIYL